MARATELMQQASRASVPQDAANIVASLDVKTENDDCGTPVRPF
jgi:hypothetical protein